MFLKRFFKQVRTNIITGVLLLIPLVLSVIILVNLFQWIDSVLPSIIGVEWIPGVGALVIITVAYFTGITAKNYFGKKLITTANKIIANIPILNKVYLAIQQIVDAATLSNKGLFQRAVLIEFPRPGCMGLGFVTSEKNMFISSKAGQNLVSVFVPTAPNPTSGFLIYAPESELTELNIPVEAAIKLVVSGGILTIDDACKTQNNATPSSVKEWAGLFKRDRDSAITEKNEK